MSLDDTGTLTADSAAVTDVSAGNGDISAGAAVTDTTTVSDDGAAEVTTDTTQQQDTTQQVDTAAVTDTTTDITVSPSPIPNELRALMANKELMANPAVAAAVKVAQSAFDRVNAYASHFPTVADAKKFTEAFPGGIPDALAAQQKAEKLDNSDAVFYSRDPQQHRELAAGWQQDDPEAYSSLIRSGLEVLHDSDPEAFKGVMLESLEQTLAGMQAAAFHRNDQEAAQRIARVHEDIFGRKPGEQPRQDPRDAKHQQREQKLQQERQEFLSSVATSFMQTSNDQVGARFEATIKASVDTALKSVKATDAQKSRLVKDIYDDINGKLRADTALQNQISAIVTAGKRAGKFTPQDQQKYVNAIYAKAQSLLRASGPQFINDWTATFLNVKRADTAKREAAGTRTDVTGGGSPNFGTKPLTGAQLLDMDQAELAKVPSQLIPPNWKQLMRDERLRRQAV